MNFEMTAKTFSGLEEVLASELITLGANDVQIQRRAVGFSGDLNLLYKANLHLRTASRILKPILSFEAKDPDEIYEAVKKISWNNYLDVDGSFAIDSTVYSEQFRHSKFISYRVKDAIADWFMEKYDRRPTVSVANPKLLINVHISHQQCTISLDSSGESLHKRGYRVEQTGAPINEALAAGMLLMAGWNGEQNFVDPMCGSGTLLIEAALIALNIPPGIYRKEFAFEKWNDFDADLFDSLYNDDSHEKAFTHKIYGSDISPMALSIAKENIKAAGVGNYIELKASPVKQLTPPAKDCLMVVNPPYGERITSKNIYELYEELGSLMKHQFPGSKIWVISSDQDCLKRIGLKPAKKIKLLNGSLECLYCKYEIFEGKRKDFLSK